MANVQPSAAYPPKVETSEILGYVEETNGIFHSRDIGRSFTLAGSTYLVFGDTFCNNANSEFVGLASNTIAVVDQDGERDRDGQPLKSRYMEIDEETGLVKPFIPLTAEEKKMEDEKRGRVTLWAFGGVVELDDGSGRLWYQKNIDHGNGNLEYCGTGIATVIDSGVEDHQPFVSRTEELMFAPHEARMGTFSTTVDEGFVYLWGDLPDGKIVLARVEQRFVDDRDEYCYYCGVDQDGEARQWLKKEWWKATPVLEGIQQGAIVRSMLFGPDRPFVFFGTSKWADSSLFMGANARLEGPWELQPVFRAEGIRETTDKGKWMYCFYPQLWASEEEKREVVVTWSEQWPGGVVAARIKFAGDGGEYLQ